ncbi:uncharacterized protein [Parasteatoda tepidariorum]|uniref:uncharacterized protein n=1 Tax=Parasteatoda tepidariorum TaxID=114398 RepID=UPI001C719796|nr:uncharacterized protein LOC107445106 [Parasteatoda tepidariorum]
MSTLNCPGGQAFDHHSNECRDQASVHCVETDHSHHHRHRRSESDTESDEMVHSINIEELRDELKEFCQELRALIKAAVKDVAPTVYSQIETHYAPTLKKFKDEVMPFVNDKVKPKMEKSLNYAKKVAHRVFEKVYKSYELSNSTHVNLVSFSDLATDLAKDLEPVLKLGKYLSARLVQDKRV